MTPCESCPTRLAPTIWRMTSAASSSGVPAAMNSARPISSRRSALIFGIVEFLPRASGAGFGSLFHHRGTEDTEDFSSVIASVARHSPRIVLHRTGIASSLRSSQCQFVFSVPLWRDLIGETVEAPRVIAEDLLLELGREIVAVREMRDRVGKFAVPMRVVGGEQDVLLGEEIGDVAQCLFFRLAGHIDAAARHVFRWLHLEERRLEAAELVLLVHMLHPERDPADPGLEKRDTQILVCLEEAAVDHRGAGEQLLRRMRAGVDLQEILEMPERVERIAARGVERDRDALLRAFLVKGPEVAMRDVRLRS